MFKPASEVHGMAEVRRREENEELESTERHFAEKIEQQAKEGCRSIILTFNGSKYLRTLLEIDLVKAGYSVEVKAQLQQSWEFSIWW